MTEPKDPLERFYTPDWVVKKFYGEVYPDIMSQRAPPKVLCPSVGKGAFARGAKAYFAGRDEQFLEREHVTGIDLDADLEHPEGVDDFLCTDFLTLGEPEDPEDRFDLIVDNPPFSKALDFIRLSLKYSDNVSFLLRMGFLASIKRNKFFREHPPSFVHVLPRRPSFKAGGFSDKYDYCFISWTAADEGTELKWLSVQPKEQK